MCQGELPEKTKQKKLNKGMTLPVLSGPHVNKISTKMCQGL